MTQFGYVEDQVLQAGQAAILQNVRPCMHCPQYVIHENLTPNINVRGITRTPCSEALYRVSFSGNIAIPGGGTAGEIQLAFFVDGAIRPLTIASATPAAAGQYWHVSGEDIIGVPMGCCPVIYVANASVSPTPATSPAPAFTVRNLQVFVDKDT